MWDRISDWWCKTMHSKAMWPIHGKYICPDCFREYPVAWDAIPTDAETSEAPAREYTWPARPAWNGLAGILKRFGTM